MTRSRAVRRTLETLGALFLAAISVVWFLSVRPPLLIYPDATEHAQIARSLVRGEGYRTRTLWLSRLTLSEQNVREWALHGAPDVRRPMLHTFVVAGFFRLFGVQDASVLWSSALFTILTAGLLFWVLRKNAGTWGAILGFFLFVLDVRTRDLSGSGLTEPLFGFLLVVLAALLFQKVSIGRSLGLGTTLALLQLTRHNAFLLVLPLGLILFLESRRVKKGSPEPLSRRIKGGALLLAPLLLVLALLSYRNGMLTGAFEPVGLPRWALFSNTGAFGEEGLFPDHGIERSLEVPDSALGFVLKHPGAFSKKVLLHLKMNLESMAGMVSPVLWILWFLALLSGNRKRSVQDILTFTILSLVLTLLFISTGEYEGDRFFVPFTPLLILGTAAFLQKAELSRKMTIPRPISALAVLVITIPGCYLLIMESIRASSSEQRTLFEDLIQERRELGRRITDLIEPGEVAVSNTPWTLGWYAERTAFWLPLHPEDLQRVNAVHPIRYVILDHSVRGSKEISPRWERLLMDSRETLLGYERHPKIGWVFVRKEETQPSDSLE